MKENHRKLLNSVIKAIDWEALLKVHHSFNYGIGLTNFAIPGLKRKEPSEEITVKDLKHELRSVIKYMIGNEIPSMQYSHWNIYWTNDEWDLSIYSDEDDYEDEEDERTINDSLEFETKSRLEVLYCPQRIMLMDPSLPEETVEAYNDLDKLRMDLKKAVSLEDYETANEIKKSIEYLKKLDK